MGDDVGYFFREDGGNLSFWNGDVKSLVAGFFAK